MIKNLPASAGDSSSIPGLGRSPGEENGNSSILEWEIPWTKEPKRATVLRVAKESDQTDSVTKQQIIVNHSSINRGTMLKSRDSLNSDLASYYFLCNQPQTLLKVSGL